MTKPKDFLVDCGGIQPKPLLAPVAGTEELTEREKNWIISAVSCRRTPTEAGLTTAEELRYYQIIWNEAQEVFDRLGVWPVFDLIELDW